jgi:hypothetical protein
MAEWIGARIILALIIFSLSSCAVRQPIAQKESYRQAVNYLMERKLVDFQTASHQPYYYKIKDFQAAKAKKVTLDYLGDERGHQEVILNKAALLDLIEKLQSSIQEGKPLPESEFIYHGDLLEESKKSDGK